MHICIFNKVEQWFGNGTTTSCSHSEAAQATHRLTLCSMSTGSTHLSIVLATTCSNNTRTKLQGTNIGNHHGSLPISTHQLDIRLTVHQAQISRDRSADSGHPLASAGGQTCQRSSSGRTPGTPIDSRENKEKLK